MTLPILRFRLLFLLLFASATVTACVPIYIPPLAHAPMLADEGEVRVAAQGSAASIDIQAAVAPVNHLGVMVSGSIWPGGAQSHYYGEGGVGYFTDFGVGRFSVYGGFGGGTASGNLNINNVDYVREGSYWRPFAQTTLGLSTKYVDFGVVARFSYAEFKIGRDDTGAKDKTSDGFYAEPVAVLRVGYDFIKVETQFGVSIPMVNTSGRFPGQVFVRGAGLELTSLPVMIQSSIGVHFVWDFWGDDELAAPAAPAPAKTPEPETTTVSEEPRSAEPESTETTTEVSAGETGAATGAEAEALPGQEIPEPPAPLEPLPEPPAEVGPEPEENTTEGKEAVPETPEAVPDLADLPIEPADDPLSLEPIGEPAPAPEAELEADKKKKKKGKKKGKKRKGKKRKRRKKR